jgi:tetratricopeptide (TPR) repeat protein
MTANHATAAHLIRRRVIRLTWIMLTLLMTRPVFAQSSIAATLLAVQGLTQLRRSGAAAFVPAYRRMGLGVGDLLRTGPRAHAELLFRDGSALSLNQNSALVIPPIAGGGHPSSFNLTAGELWARVVHGRHLQFVTPTAVAGVRGTELNLRVDADGTSTLTVADGEVSFHNPRGSVVVRASQQSIARPGQAPTLPVTVNVPVILEWTNDVLPAILLLETQFVSSDPVVLTQAAAAAQALPLGADRERRLGDVEHDRGNLTGALAAYDRASAALPAGAGPAERAVVLGRRGQALLELGRLPEALAAFEAALAADPSALEPRLGRVMALISRRQLDAALAEAQAAVTAAPTAGRAHMALALVRIRREERGEATSEIALALTLEPNLGQAHAWQAYLLRAEGRLGQAEAAARQAVALAPRSAVAQQSLADVLFLTGRARDARVVAARAVALNPLSAAAQVALGQAELSLGDIAAAVRAAHRAAALDPDLERARYFLGVALAEEQDLGGAARQLRAALVLDPRLIEARVLLARVLGDEGRAEEAEQEARVAVAQAPENGPARSALGRLLWRTGRLNEAVASYQEALRLSPGSVLAHLELARVYLDQNHLPEALREALDAVDRANGSSEAHAILGLVYERSNTNEQALREYREAVSLSPENALARIGLALQNPSSEDAFAEFSQALLRDPAVLQQEFKPGVTTEVNAHGGTQDQYGAGFRHRDQYADGKVHDFSIGFNDHDGGWRGNDDMLTRLVNINLAARPAPAFNLLYRLVHFAEYFGEPGTTFQPDRDGRFRTSIFSQALVGRYQVAPRTHLWLDGAYQVSHAGDRNPGSPSDGNLRLKGDQRDGDSRFELRLDHRLGRADALTYGYFTSNDALAADGQNWDEPSQSFTGLPISVRFRDDVQYAQLDHRSGRLTATLGAQHERTIDRFSFLDTATRGARWLPYGVGTVQVGPRTLIRLLGHERTARLETAGLLPTEAFITGELVTPTFGGRVKTFELDLEHRFSARLFTKLFAFRSDVQDLLIDEPVEITRPIGGFTVPQARLEGFGLRVERQITPLLAGYLRVTTGRATDRDSGPTHGRQLPQSPHSTGVFGLNYVDRAGAKALLEFLYSSLTFSESLWTDTEGFDPLAPRPHEPSRLLVNLRVGQERSVRQEWIVHVDNLLNRAYSLWPGVPGRGRTFTFELRERF